MNTSVCKQSILDRKKRVLTWGAYQVSCFNSIIEDAEGEVTSVLYTQSACLQEIISPQIQSGFFFSKILMTFLKITVGRRQKDKFLLVVFICVYFKMLVITKIRYKIISLLLFCVTGEISWFGSRRLGMSFNLGHHPETKAQLDRR